MNPHPAGRIWTRAAVEHALIDAVRLLHRMTRDPMPSLPRSLHPEIVRDYGDALSAEDGRDKRAWSWSKPKAFDPAAIARAEAICEWVRLHLLTAEDRRIVWSWINARAFRREWSVTREISDHHTGSEAVKRRMRAYRTRDMLLSVIADRLNVKRVDPVSLARLEKKSA